MRRLVVFIAVLLWSSALVFTQAAKQPTQAPQQKSEAQNSPAQSTQLVLAMPQSANPPAARQSTSPARPPAAAPKPSAAELALEQKAKEEAARIASEAAAVKAAAEKQKIATDLIHEWFIRWNALSDNTPEAIDRFVEMYYTEATHEVGPSEKQAGGPVTYRGEKLIRKMAEDQARKWNDIDYVIAVRTASEKSTELISTADTPWGNTQIAVEYLGGQTSRENKKRFMIRGAGFFEFENGKITRARMYIPSEETVEVTGPFKVM